jgi:hypothetical protein
MKIGIMDRTPGRFLGKWRNWKPASQARNSECTQSEESRPRLIPVILPIACRSISHLESNVIVSQRPPAWGPLDRPGFPRAETLGLGFPCPGLPERVQKLRCVATTTPPRQRNASVARRIAGERHINTRCILPISYGDRQVATDSLSDGFVAGVAENATNGPGANWQEVALDAVVLLQGRQCASGWTK